MKRAAWLALLMSVGSTPAFAQQVVTGLTYDVDAQDAIRIEVLGTSPLEAPRIRAQRGQIRAWFPNIDNNPRVTTPGDGDVLDSVQLRPGVADTAVLTIDLASRTRLSSEALTYEATERGGVISIARSALPAVQIVASVTPVEPAEPEAIEEPEPEAAAPTEVQAETASNAEEPEEETEAGTPLFAERNTPTASSTGDEGKSMGALLLISLLLGALYMLIKTVQKKRKVILDDDISVVATKRLGPRYQLMVVRALGQDHLLSVHRGQTQVLSSMDSPTAAESAALEERGLSILDRIQGKVEDTVQLSSPAPIADEDRFGAKLLNLQAIRQRMQSSEPTESEAVAGLMRLRARAAK